MEIQVDKPKNEAFAAWYYRDFRLYFGLRFFFTCAIMMQATVLGFYIYQQTHSTVAIAMMGLSEVIPAITIALYGGHVADRCEKRKLLLTVLAGILLAAIGLLVVTHPDLHKLPATGWQMPAIYFLLFGNGVARAFYEPAIFSIYAGSIPRHVYPNASNWANLSWQAGFISGPFVGGLIYAYAGGISGSCITVIALLLLSCIFAGLLKKYPAANMKQENQRANFTGGLRFVFRNKIMLYTMSLDLFSVLFGGVMALLPVYAIDILKVGAAGLGTMRMASSLGAVLMMPLLLKYPPTGRPWRNLLLAIAGFGGSVIAFGLSHLYFLSLLFLFAQGAFDSISVVVRGTLMQLLTPEEMRGRVAAVNSMFISSSAELGDVESGLVAGCLGTVPAVMFGGVLTLLIVGFTYMKTKRLVSLTLDELQEG